MSRGDAERDATLRAHGLGAHARLEKESAAKLRAAAQLVVKNESVTPATWQPLSTIMADAIAALGEALRSE